MAELVYCTCLENKSLGNRTVSSNLTSSANVKTPSIDGVFTFAEEVVTVLWHCYGDSNEKPVYENEKQKLGSVFLLLIFVGFSRGRGWENFYEREARSKKSLAVTGSHLLKLLWFMEIRMRPGKSSLTTARRR